MLKSINPYNPNKKVFVISILFPFFDRRSIKKRCVEKMRQAAFASSLLVFEQMIL
jgi:hypothetical protein